MRTCLASIICAYEISSTGKYVHNDKAGIYRDAVVVFSVDFYWHAENQETWKQQQNEEKIKEKKRETSSPGDRAHFCFYGLLTTSMNEEQITDNKLIQIRIYW